MLELLTNLSLLAGAVILCAASYLFGARKTLNRLVASTSLGQLPEVRAVYKVYNTLTDKPPEELEAVDGLKAARAILAEVDLDQIDDDEIRQNARVARASLGGALDVWEGEGTHDQTTPNLEP